MSRCACCHSSSLCPHPASANVAKNATSNEPMRTFKLCIDDLVGSPSKRERRYRPRSGRVKRVRRRPSSRAGLGWVPSTPAGRRQARRSTFLLTGNVRDHIRHLRSTSNQEDDDGCEEGRQEGQEGRGKKTKTTKKAAKTAKKPAKRKAAKKPAKRAAAKKPVKKAAPRSAGEDPRGGVQRRAPKAAPPAGVPSMLGGAPTSSHGADDGEE